MRPSEFFWFIVSITVALGLLLAFAIYVSTPDTPPAENYSCYDADRTHDAPGCEGR